MTFSNQRHPQRREYNILMETYPSIKEGHADLCHIIWPWAADLGDLRTGGVTFNVRCRDVWLFVHGDFMFLSNVMGHLGPTCHMSSLWCLEFHVPSVDRKNETSIFGSMLRSEEPPRHLRSRTHLVDMAATYAKERKSLLPLTLTLREHFSLERRPLLTPHPNKI